VVWVVAVFPEAVAVAVEGEAGSINLKCKNQKAKIC
jgi:hypothetical protein